MSFYKLIRPFLFCLPPETAHAFSLNMLRFASHFYSARSIEKNPVNVAGLHFPNPVGIAAGLDKNADYLDALLGLGCGFIEVGAITPKPQAGNPKPRLFRVKEKEALINRMGFNNKGVDYLVDQLKQRKSTGIVGVNIGKNKTTPLEEAYQDYEICLEKIKHYADFATINISSPNTPGLRDLQKADYLVDLLNRLKKKEQSIPLFVKLSPDMLDHEILAVCDVLLTTHIDGVIATNTTTRRYGIANRPVSKEAGGLSGDPLFERAHYVVSMIARKIQGRLPIVAVGGINSVERARIMLNAGADLIQLYSGLIYEGPGLVKKIIRCL